MLDFSPDSLSSTELPQISSDDEIDIAKSISLRIRIGTNQLLLDAKPEGGNWKHYLSLPIPANFGSATAFRVGKRDKQGGNTDSDAEGEMVRLHIDQVAFYGAFDREKLLELREKQGKQKNATVSVHYEIYDGLPALSKWITVHNPSNQAINLDTFNAETLAVVERENSVGTRDEVPPLLPNTLHVETDMSFGGFTHRNANAHTVHWLNDKSYTCQVNYSLQQLCLLKIEPTYGPDQTIQAGGTFESFRVFELIYDTDERERCSLALRQMYRTLAPWVTENPLMLHCQSSDEAIVKNAIDQAVETGFEMVILSFGSGFDAENDDPGYLAQWKKINDYATKKQIHLGSYSLYSSRNAGVENNIVTPRGESNAHGVCPAITSPSGQNYLRKLEQLFDKTGFMVFENDGPYPGDVDITARPPLQKGRELL